MDDLNQNPKLGSADRPNSYIGRSVPRERAKKLLEGKGCLLYTSPSPRDGLLSRMPSSA